MPDLGLFEGYPFSVHLGELLFTVLPFGVLFLVYLFQGKSADTFLYAPEWAFGASILFGQTIVKFVQGIIESTRTSRTIAERVGLLVTVFIVLGLVPSLVVLALLLTTNSPPLWLGILQLILFALAAICFLLFGSLAYSEAVRVRKILSDNIRTQ
jgi:hypothetical protein